MRIFQYVVAVAAGVSVGMTLAPAKQDGDKLTAATLKNMLSGMGYELKTLNAEEGKEKYEIPLKSANLNIPVAAELSPSGNYIWFTVNLGMNSSTKKHEELLKENFNIQPTFFYITAKGNLMAAEAVDNRAVSASVFKRVLDKIVLDVDKTSKVWQD